MEDNLFTCATCRGTYPRHDQNGRDAEGSPICYRCVPPIEVQPPALLDGPQEFTCPWCVEYGSEPTTHWISEAVGLDEENRPVCGPCVDIRAAAMLAESGIPETIRELPEPPIGEARRLMALVLDANHFPMLAEGSVVEVLRNELPEGAQCVGSHYNAVTHAWWLVYTHPSFDAVPFGVEIPHFDEGLVLRARPSIGLQPGQAAEAEKILNDILGEKQKERRERLDAAAHRLAKKKRRTSKEI